MACTLGQRCSPLPWADRSSRVCRPLSTSTCTGPLAAIKIFVCLGFSLGFTLKSRRKRQPKTQNPKPLQQTANPLRASLCHTRDRPGGASPPRSLPNFAPPQLPYPRGRWLVEVVGNANDKWVALGRVLFTSMLVSWSHRAAPCAQSVRVLYLLALVQLGNRVYHGPSLTFKPQPPPPNSLAPALGFRRMPSARANACRAERCAVGLGI